MTILHNNLPVGVICSRRERLCRGELQRPTELLRDLDAVVNARHFKHLPKPTTGLVRELCGALLDTNCAADDDCEKPGSLLTAASHSSVGFG
jgi:hypothetical protein